MEERKKLIKLLKNAVINLGFSTEENIIRKRNVLLKVIEIEQRNFNKRLKRMKEKFSIIGYRVDIDKWTEDEFMIFMDELVETLQELTNFQIYKEIKTEEFEDFDIMNSYSKFRIIECRLSIGRKDFELVKIGTKNRIR